MLCRMHVTHNCLPSNVLPTGMSVLRLAEVHAWNRSYSFLHLILTNFYSLAYATNRILFILQSIYNSAPWICMYIKQLQLIHL